MAEADGQRRGKVIEVCRQFLASTDEGLAHRLQDEEYGLKYKWNRETRQVARKDVPMAKDCHAEEEERQQRERFDFLQKQSKLAEEDEQMALQLQKEEQLNTEQQKANLAERDAEVALQLQQQEEKRKEVLANRTECDDARIALQMQKDEILGKERNRVKREMEDQAVAQRFQEEERQLAEMKTTERDLREQRRLLELELLHEVQMEEMLGEGQQGSSLNSRRPTVNRDTVAILGGAADGYRLSNMDYMSEEERREILKMQDEELAKALQEHEEKKARRARREISAEIEQQDYQLARIMQEVEKLELQKRRYAEERGTYIIFPVAHVEPSHSSVSRLNSRGGDGGTTTNRNVANSTEYSLISVSTDNDHGAAGGFPRGTGPPVYSVPSRSVTQQSNTANNDSMRLGSSSSAGYSTSPQSCFPPTTSAPLTPTTPTPMSASPGARQGPQFATTTHTRVTETRITSQPAVVPRDNNTRPMFNNQAGSATQVPPPRRQSSKDKSCKQQ